MTRISWPPLLARAGLHLKQAIRSLNRRRLRHRRAGKRAAYADWVVRHDSLGPAERAALHQRLAALPATPLLSVLMPTWQPDLAMIRTAVASVQGQIYPHWQLCIADDASNNAELDTLLAELQAGDARVKVVKRLKNGHICEASNSALALADGPWVLLLDHDDVLTEHALLLMAEAISAFPDAGLIYSDEDKLGPQGQRESPNFKPDWNHDLCLAQNLVCHLTAIRSDLMRRIGGMRKGFEGAQDHDLVLRIAEQLQPGQIVHVPHVLYHWRMHAGSTAAGADVKPYAQEAGRRAVQEHLQRSSSPATVESVGSGRYRVRWPLPAALPLVSILIPTRNQLGLLRQCIQTLDRLTDYPNRELIVIDNGSDDADTLAYLKALEARPDLRVLRDPRPFNYSALNNLAARQARGEYLALLNNDIEVIDGQWLGEMLSLACRPEVGAVGAKLLYPDLSIQHGGVILGTTRGDGFGGVAGPAQKGLARAAGGYAGRALLTQAFSAVTAACMVVKRSKFDQVGGLEETHLAVAYNDVDLCLRLQRAGYINLWTPFAELIHHESVSRGRDRSADNQDRFMHERAYMQQRWGDTLRRDPAYNLNLNLAQGDFSLACPPRHDWARPWFEPDPTANPHDAALNRPMPP
jgi:glycosyltransferase involved in cell wall biosynthesis